MIAEEPDNPQFVLQAGHVDVEVHPVDSLNGEPHMTVDDFGHTLCYHLSGSGRACFASCRLFHPCAPTEPGFIRARQWPRPRSPKYCPNKASPGPESSPHASSV